MDAASIVAIIFGVLTVLGFLFGCAWKFSWSMGRLTAAVKQNIEKTNETLQIVKDHATVCDKERAEMAVKHAAIGHTLDAHHDRLANLESTP